jgi:hypothetical protein
LSIGSGKAEIFTDRPQQIYLQTDTGNLAYWNVETPGNPLILVPPIVISGLGSSSLSVSALSFNYNMGGVVEMTSTLRQSNVKQRCVNVPFPLPQGFDGCHNDGWVWSSGAMPLGGHRCPP